MKIVADSGCDFTIDMTNKNDINIERVPLTLQLNDKQFIDDDSLDIPKYLDEMWAFNGIPKTAAPSPELFLEKFKGGDSIFAVTLSSHLSASYSNAVVARSMYLEEYGNKIIHVFDSLSASAGETVISLKINEFIKQNCSELEIIEQVSNFITNMKTFFILENYNNLVKNGRINAYVAKLSSLLSIKPICRSLGGKMDLFDKARGYNKAIEKLINHIAATATDTENKVLGISHVNAIEKALTFKKEIAKKIKFKDIVIVSATGLCSTYADKEGIVVAY